MASKKLVFHLGVNAGFFSEYNNMLLGYIYSLDNNMNFQIYSRDANFGYNKGWTDYFAPFTKESTWNYHHKYNYRSVDEFNYFKSRKLIRKISFWKFISKTDYLTYEIFDKIRSSEFVNKNFTIGEHQDKNELKNIFAELVKKTWRYNDLTKSLILSLTINLNLPNNYVGIHIRGGDKKNEFKLFSIHEYINKVKELTDNKNLFIATDDFDNVKQIKINYPEYYCFYLCKEEKQGYDQKTFEKQNKTIIRNEMIELFATTDILTNADYFIGTYSSNIGTFIASRRNYVDSYALDFEEWRVW
ncbi:MAG: hypothetical protein Q7W45_14335 [Bacteroidota bacterium]|nr:hypothetical protein [Bacteroidota bacterium]MDP3144352.1 hypothetical protein [Bacteroidota bacterium]